MTASSDFSGYLALGGSPSDDEHDDIERQQDLEAELYSKIHYQENLDIEETPKAPEETNFCLDVLKELREKEPSNEVHREAERCVSPVASECSSKFVNIGSAYTSFDRVGCDNVLDDSKLTESKYTSVQSKNKTIELDSSNDDDSEEDSGIQVLDSVIKEPKKNDTIVLDLLDDSTSSDSEVEHLPILDKSKKSPKGSGAVKVIVEKDEESAAVSNQSQKPNNNVLVKSRPGNGVNKHLKITGNDSTSSESSDSMSDDDDFPGSTKAPRDLCLNLSGTLTGTNFQHRQRTFARITANSNEHCDAVNAASARKWTPEMKRFYNDVNPDHADITIEQCMSSLPNEVDWSVRKPHATPSIFSRLPASRYFHSQKCKNCKRDGHMASACLEPKRVKICHVCCGEGHFVSYCPNAHCIRCGTPSRAYSGKCQRCVNVDRKDCRLCGGRGHVQSNCPDTWRRYHATTEADLDGNVGVKVPANRETSHIPVNDVWCCNCSRKGHYVHQCRAFSFSAYPLPVLSIVTYDTPGGGKGGNKRPLEAVADYEPRSVKRRRLRQELKERKRSYKSVPSTPPASVPNHNKSLNSLSEPGSPVLNQQWDPDETLADAKDSLFDLIQKKHGNAKPDDDDESIGQKNWRNKKRQKRKDFKKAAAAAKKKTSGGEAPSYLSVKAKIKKRSSFPRDHRHQDFVSGQGNAKAKRHSDGELFSLKSLRFMGKKGTQNTRNSFC